MNRDKDIDNHLLKEIYEENQGLVFNDFDYVVNSVEKNNYLDDNDVQN